MIATFEQVRPFTHTLKLTNLPFSIDDILTEVNSYNYTQWPLSYNRYKCSRPDQFGPIVSNLRTFFISNEFQTQIIDTMPNEFWSTYWKEDPLKFKQRLRPIFECDIDMPGFQMVPHLDDRGIVLVGLCHFTRSDDPNKSTIFYTSETQENPLRIPTGFGVGWLSANLHNTWHSGSNQSNDTRFSIKYGARINF